LIFVYTNGLLASCEDLNWFEGRIQGFNVGCHGPISQAIEAVKILDKIAPTRLHLWEGRRLEILYPPKDITIKLWKMNECDNNEEDRWIV
jgi:hypothetical protein